MHRFFLSLFLLLPAALSARADIGLAMHGAPALADGFDRYAYAAPAARKGGVLRQAHIGSFDNLNPFSIRGNTARDLRPYIFESLLSRNYDEPFALYALVAARVFTPKNRASVSFILNPAARFSDGRPIRAEDVAFSARKLRTEGRPNHRYYYSKIAKIDTQADRITFHFKPEANGEYDREMPLIIGLMPILPKHIYAAKDLQKVSLAAPIGSGPYRIATLDAGRRIVLKRNPDYWGVNIPTQRGRFNFARIEHIYFRDKVSAFAAFKSGLVDIWFEENPKRWAQISGGDIIKQAIPLARATGLRAIVLNTRREILRPPLRRALDLLFDFQWVNRALFDNAYARTVSYFGRSDMSAYGRPATPAERALLKGSGLDATALAKGYHPPRSDGSGRDRRLHRAARDGLKKAGYRYRDGKLYAPDGRAVSLELIVRSRDDERLALAYQRMLRAAGITLAVRFIDSTQYQNRLKNFDFDLIIYDYYASLSPGNEQAYYWSRAAASQIGSRNYAGIKNAAMERAIAALTAAQTRQDFAIAARAIDRILLNGGYFVPLYHRPKQWVARHKHIRHGGHARQGAQIDSWWSAK